MANLKESHRRLNPAKLPSSQELEQYIKRPNLETSKLVLKLQNRTGPLRTLMIGQRGVGKTTELYRLVNDLGMETKYFLSPDDIRIRDMASGVAFITWHLAQKANLAKEEIDRAQSYFEHLIQITSQGATVTREGEAEAFRHLEHMVKYVQDKFGDPILLLDNFDRFAPSEGLDFVHRIAKIDCSVVVVADPQPILEKKLDPMRNGWDELMLMPAIAVLTPERKPNPEGKQFIANLVAKRAEANSFEFPALELISRESGGVPRIALQLAAESCMQAIVQGKSTFVSVESARAAVQHYRLKFTHFIPISDIEALKSFAVGSQATYDPNWAEFLDKQYVFFFQSADEIMSLWFDVHPLLWPILGIKEGNSTKE